MQYHSLGEDKLFNFLWLAFVTCLLVANLGATKLFAIAGLTLPAGIIIFPVLFIINDILTEIYGFSASRRVIWSALLVNLFASMTLYLMVLLPSDIPYGNSESFANIFSLSPLILFASITSYFIGENANAILISSMKIICKGKYFPQRAILSTLIGAFLETSIFVFIAFSGILELDELLKMIGIMIVIKVGYEILCIPFTFLLVKHIKLSRGIDVFESPSLASIVPGSFFKSRS